MNDWQIFNWQVTIITGIIAVILALINTLWSLFEKRKQLRFKRFKLAKDLIDEIYEFKNSFDALKMIDGIITADIKKSLSQTTVYDAKNDHVRECFDALLYSLERIEYAISIKVVKFDDVKSHFEYYAEKMVKDIEVYIIYAKFIKYFKAVKFLNRFLKNI